MHQGNLMAAQLSVNSDLLLQLDSSMASIANTDKKEQGDNQLAQ
jgi:hypothetical protein